MLAGTGASCAAQGLAQGRQPVRLKLSQNWLMEKPNKAFVIAARTVAIAGGCVAVAIGGAWLYEKYQAIQIDRCIQNNMTAVNKRFKSDPQLIESFKVECERGDPPPQGF